jgi:hypothetical protein
MAKTQRATKVYRKKANKTAKKRMNKKRPRTQRRTRRGGNSTLIRNIKESLHDEMMKGNIDNECYQCLMNNKDDIVGKMVREKSRQWGDLTVSEWTTRVLFDNTECPDCIV